MITETITSTADVSVGDTALVFDRVVKAHVPRRVTEVGDGFVRLDAPEGSVGMIIVRHGRTFERVVS